MNENDNGAQEQTTTKPGDDSGYTQPEIGQSVEEISEADITFPGESGGEGGAQQTTGDEGGGEGTPPPDDDTKGASKVNLKTEGDQTIDGQDDKTKGDGEGGSDTSPESSSAEEGGTSPAPDANTNQPSGEGSEASDEDTWNYLTEESSVQVDSIDDLVTNLKELAELRKGKGQSNQELSPAMQEAIRVEAAGGDLSEHFRRVGMDFEKMDAREVLRQKFFNDNAKQHKVNPRFAQMMFERKLKEDYGTYFEYSALTDETEKQDFVEQHGKDEIEFQKELYEFNVAEARNGLAEWQKTSKPTAAATTSESGVPQYSKEKIDEINRVYAEKVKKSLPEFTGASIPMGENQKDYVLGLNDKTRPLVEGWINNPSTFLHAIGIEEGNADPDLLLPVMTVIAELAEGNLGSRLQKFVLDSADLQTLEKKIDTPPIIKTDVGGESELDEWEKVGEAASEARKSRAGGM